jgi:hypothetical protein
MSLRAFVTLLCCVLAAPLQAQTLQLITDDEARLPVMAVKPPSRAITRGPAVKLGSPDAVTVGFPLKVACEPRGGSKIDPASVRVEYLKGPGIDLTERVKAGIRPEGIEIASAAAPAGPHPIRVSVRDSEGRVGTAEFTLLVK